MDTVILALRVLVALGVVVALLWVVQRRSARWAAKRPDATVIDVTGKRSLGSKANVVVVDVDGTRFVLGVTEHNVSVLHAAPAPKTAPRHVDAVEARPTHDFARLLERSSAGALLARSGWKPLAKTRRGRH